MVHRFSKALLDVKQGRYLETYIGLVLAGAAVAANIVSAFVTNVGFTATLTASTIVFLLGVVALTTAEVRRDMPANGQAGSKLTGFFGNRSELPSLRLQLQLASQLVTIIGLQLGQVVHELLPVIEQRARAGCKVNLALTSPVDEKGDKCVWVDDLGAVHGFPNLEELLHVNLHRLVRWHGNLAPDVKDNISIRAYLSIPTASVVIYDPSTRHGYIHVEPILHGFDPGERPTFWLRRTDDAPLFELILSRYGELWEQAIPLNDLKI